MKKINLSILFFCLIPTVYATKSNYDLCATSVKKYQKIQFKKLPEFFQKISGSYTIFAKSLEPIADPHNWFLKNKDVFPRRPSLKNGNSLKASYNFSSRTSLLIRYTELNSESISSVYSNGEPKRKLGAPVVEVGFLHPMRVISLLVGQLATKNNVSSIIVPLDQSGKKGSAKLELIDENVIYFSWQHSLKNSDPPHPFPISFLARKNSKYEQEVDLEYKFFSESKWKKCETFSN